MRGMNDKPRLAPRMRHIEPFRVMDLLARARALEAAGRDIVHLQIGEPDFPTPEPVRERAARVLREDPLHYTPALGLPALREAIARHYEEREGVSVSPERIVVTPGSSAALQLVIAALVGRDEGVLLGDPGYPCNRNFVHLFEGRVVSVPTRPETGFQPTPELLEAHAGTDARLLLLASPANPTGSVLQAPALRALLAWCAERGVVPVVDEIYRGLFHGTQIPPTALALSDEVFVVNSFSKYYGMTGWRVGWVVAPEWAIEPLDRLAQNLYLSAPTLGQQAALVAFAPATLEILEQRRAEFTRRRDFLLPALESLGFRIPVVPEGAFYLYADCSAFTDDSEAFVQRLLEEAGVAITPGTDFGRAQADTFVRFAFTRPVAVLERAVEYLSRSLAGTGA